MSDVIKVRVFPLFERGMAFSSDMINSLRDYAFDYSNLYLLDLSDGIVSGIDILTDGDTIKITKGIIKYKDIIYLISEDISIVYSATENTQILKLVFLREIKTLKSSYSEVEIGFTDTDKLELNEIELCRFKLKSGSKLRVNYVDFSDRNTEFDTVNRINTLFSARSKATLSQELLLSFAREILAYELEDIDKQFSMNLLSASFFTNKEYIDTYIALKLNKEFQTLTNIESYTYLKSILENISSGKKRETEKKKKRIRQIIVD